ncbi:MAG TPA: DUF4231 domain-containing protein, partial [Candidatus Acidoferrum sp.]|nr:DUF4231 domain-containing protein [Candidatus Acidoferrum sp.]
MDNHGQRGSLPKGDRDQAHQFVLQRYKESIDFYWRSSRTNKRGYKITRYLTVVLGSLVTLISSLSAAEFIKSKPAWALSFSILTPAFAATLAIVGGFSQSFQWGPTWREMVLTAEELTKECDRIYVTPAEQLDPPKELALLDDLMLRETRGFFERMFGTSEPSK